MLRLPSVLSSCALLLCPSGAFAQVGAGDLEDLFEDLGDPVALDAPLELEDDELDALLDGALQGTSSEPSSTGAGASPLREWRGFVELKPRAYLRDRGGEDNDEQLLFETELELDFRFSEQWSGYFRPRMFLDALDSELERFEPYESYVTLSGESWDARAGQFVENWGIVDTYNPLDVLNRRDFATDPLDADRLGELGVRLRKTYPGGATIGEPTLSLYALPAFRETRFGTRNQRIGLGSPSVPFDEAAGFEPSGSERGFYALRYQSTLATALFNADIQAIAARGPARTPIVAPDGSGGLAPVYYGAETYGVGIRAVPNESRAGEFLSSLTLKAEIVQTQPFTFDDSPVAEPADYLTCVFGVDRGFYGIFDPQDDLTLTVEYASDNGEDDPAAFLRPFRDDLVVRGLYSANDFARQSLELRALVDLDVDEQVYELLYERQLRSLHEDLKLTIQFQLFEAAPDGQTLFGSIEDPTSIAVGLRFDA